MVVNKTCMVCRKQHAIVIEDEAFHKWMQGGHIQDLAPQLSVDDRELLISGVCGTCFDALFQDEDIEGLEEEDDTENF